MKLTRYFAIISQVFKLLHFAMQTCQYQLGLNIFYKSSKLHFFKSKNYWKTISQLIQTQILCLGLIVAGFYSDNSMIARFMSRSRLRLFLPLLKYNFPLFHSQKINNHSQDFQSTISMSILFHFISVACKDTTLF